jgi:hypothetical protein
MAKAKRLSAADKRKKSGEKAEAMALFPCPICGLMLRKIERSEALTFWARFPGCWLGSGAIPCADSVCALGHEWNVKHCAEYRWTPRKQIIMEHISRKCARIYAENVPHWGMIFVVTNRLSEVTYVAIRDVSKAYRMDVHPMTIKFIFAK